MMRDDWDTWFLKMAGFVSTRSKDPSTKVGAVIVDDKRRVLGIGYNGFPRGVEDNLERLENREMKYPRVVHAEVNAVLNAARTEGCTLYCTFCPCPQCAALIIQAGIRRVVAIASPSDHRWADQQKVSISMFKEAGVEYVYH